MKDLQPKFKILLVTHKPFCIPKGDFWLPIHAGREIAKEISKDGVISDNNLKWLEENTIGDDTGDNISARNRYYCECSALYWAWKHYEEIGNPEYIGLNHYRRHFVFNDEYFMNHKNKCNRLSYIHENFIDENYINNIGLTKENIEKACANYDIIVTKDSDFTSWGAKETIREDYEKSIPEMQVKDFDLMVQKIDELYPQYSKLTHNFINGYNKCLFQMFIMKKDLFFEYCEFLFNILFSIENEVDFSTYSTLGKRALGYLAEILLSIFVYKKFEENKKILKLGVTHIEYPLNMEELKHIISEGCPSYFKYIKFKILSLIKKDKEKYKQKYKIIRIQRNTYHTVKRRINAN